jgi:hypothetical protein
VLPQTDNTEVDYLPNIINKIRDKQLIPHIHKLAHDYKQACTNRPSGNPPHSEFLKMFHTMMKDENKYDINYDPLTKELPEKPKKEDPPPPPGSPEIKLNADHDDTNFDTESTIDDKEPEKPRINMFNDRTELRNYLIEKRKRQRENIQEENEAENHQQKYRRQSTRANTPESHRSRSRPRRDSTKSNTPEKHRSRSRPRRDSSQTSSKRSSHHSHDSERRRHDSERRRQRSPPPCRDFDTSYVPHRMPDHKSTPRPKRDRTPPRSYPAYFDKSKLPLYNKKSMPNPHKFRHTVLADGTIVMIQKQTYATRHKQRE